MLPRKHGTHGPVSRYGLYHLTFGISAIIVERDIGAIRSHDASSRQAASDGTFENEPILRQSPAILGEMQLASYNKLIGVEEAIAARINAIPVPSSILTQRNRLIALFGLFLGV
jgi:hypothetical protein